MKVLRFTANVRQIGFMSLYGLALVWSPMFGTSETFVFPALQMDSDALLFSRLANLLAFGLVMGLLAVLSERAQRACSSSQVKIGGVVLGCAGMAIGSLTGLGVLPL